MRRIACVYFPLCGREGIGKCSRCERHVCSYHALRHEAECGPPDTEPRPHIEANVCCRCGHEYKCHSTRCESQRRNGEPCKCPSYLDPIKAYREARMLEEARR